jgi:hypothetical protein
MFTFDDTRRRAFAAARRARRAIVVDCVAPSESVYQPCAASVVKSKPSSACFGFTRRVYSGSKPIGHEERK